MNSTRYSSMYFASLRLASMFTTVSLGLALLCAGEARATYDNIPFGQSDSAIELQSTLYRHVLPKNYQVNSYTFRFPSLEALRSSVEHSASLREFVFEAAERICYRIQLNSPDCQRVEREVQRSTVEESSGAMAANVMAHWFYSLYGEEWFALDQVERHTITYFRQGIKQMFLFKNFDPENIVSAPLAGHDLPVVVDYAENSATFFALQLND